MVGLLRCGFGVAGGGRRRSPKVGIVCYSVGFVLQGITFPSISGMRWFFARAEPKSNLGSEGVSMNPHQISSARVPVDGHCLPMACADLDIHLMGSFFVSNGGSWVIVKT